MEEEVRGKTRFSLRLVNFEIPVKQPDRKVRC